MYLKSVFHNSHYKHLVASPPMDMIDPPSYTNIVEERKLVSRLLAKTVRQEVKKLVNS